MPRWIEVFIAAAGLVALLSFLVVIALLIALTDKGPVFFRAKRVGKDGKEFTLLKFRTMAVRSDRNGTPITTQRDARITPLGRILRKHKLDELPQLFNVLRGEMSLVGARPEDPRYVAFYTPDQRQVLAFRPGMTSPASLEYRDEASYLKHEDWHEQYVGVILPRKLAIDLAYLQQRTFFSDILIIVRTLGGIVK